MVTHDKFGRKMETEVIVSKNSQSIMLYQILIVYHNNHCINFSADYIGAVV